MDLEIKSQMTNLSRFIKANKEEKKFPEKSHENPFESSTL